MSTLFIDAWVNRSPFHLPLHICLRYAVTSSRGASIRSTFPPIAWADQFLTSTWYKTLLASTHASRRCPCVVPGVHRSPTTWAGRPCRLRQWITRATPSSSPATATMAVACFLLATGASSKNSSSFSRSTEIKSAGFTSRCVTSHCPVRNSALSNP
jgi:hypothetical protein